MSKVVVYGIGGFDPNLPNNNIIEEYDIPDEPEPQADVTAIAETLSSLPEPQLNELITLLSNANTPDPPAEPII